MGEGRASHGPFQRKRAEKPSHAIFHALRAVKSSHFTNVCFLRKISISMSKIAGTVLQKLINHRMGIISLL